MGKKKSKSKTKSEPWKPLQPHILGAANTVSGIVNNNQGNLESIAGDVRGFLPQLGQMAFGPQAGVGAAQGYATDVMGGKYLGQGNPYMNSMIDQTRQNVGNAMDSKFSLAGRTGGGNHYERAAEGMANAENQLRYQDYGAERDRMGQAASLIPGLTQAQYAGIQPYLAAAQTAGQLPYAGAGALSPLLGMAAGSGTSTQTQSNGGGMLGGLLGAASLAVPFIPGFGASDRNLKTNVSLVGELPDGLKVYDFEYRRDLDPELPEGRHRGVMAQEAALLRPWAVETRDGRLGVNYGAL